MGLLDAAKRLKLDNLKAAATGGVGVVALKKITDNINLNNISLDNLKSLTNSRFTSGVDWNALPLDKMDSDTMNSIAPGSLNTADLKKKFSPSSLVKGRTTEVVDTQSGHMAVTSEVKINGDVEDSLSNKVISQGTNLQMENRASEIRTQASSSKGIQSNFIGKEMVS